LKFAKTVRAHWSGIVHFVESRLSNGILEGINHKVQLAKRRARADLPPSISLNPLIMHLMMPKTPGYVVM